MRALFSIVAILIILLCNIANAKSHTERKPASEIIASAGITKDMQNTVEHHWLFKAVKKHYSAFYIYEAGLEDTKSEDLKRDGDKLVTIKYATFDDKAKNSEEDSVTFEASYNSKEKSIVLLKVSQGNCWSDMCGP